MGCEKVTSILPKNFLAVAFAHCYKLTHTSHISTESVMRLYVVCRKCNTKIYFRSEAKTRHELPHHFELSCNVLLCRHKEIYTPGDVIAEPNLSASSGALLGGLIGLVGGPEGAIICGILGAGIGEKIERDEHEAVRRFNEVQA
ncbi:MAG: hypothetical protein ACOY58_03320 [Candidatus Micrarchaeota archaeon]